MSVDQAHARISLISIVTILDRLALRPHFRNRLLSYHHRTKAVRRRTEYCRIYLLSPSWHLAPPVACRSCEWLPNVRIPQTVHIHNFDVFCKLFNALISAYKFVVFFPLPTTFDEILTKNGGNFGYIYIIRNRRLDAWNYWKKPEWVEEMTTFCLSGPLLKLPIMFSHDTWPIILSACAKFWDPGFELGVSHDL